MSDFPLRYRFQKLMSSQRSSTAKDLANRFPTTPDCSPPAEIDGSSSRVPGSGASSKALTSSRLRMSGKELVWWFAELLGELGATQKWTRSLGRQLGHCLDGGGTGVIVEDLRLSRNPRLSGLSAVSLLDFLFLWRMPSSGLCERYAAFPCGHVSLPFSAV